MDFKRTNDLNFKFKKIQELINLKGIFQHIEEKISLAPDESISCLLAPFQADISDTVTNLYLELFLYFEKDNQLLRNILDHIDEILGFNSEYFRSFWENLRMITNN
ncbi:hypothetical protein NBO_78g0015 [Nosema bombycis CQ1]|uniref:Uncharacterized protein n=1 Tax=Nosema bombycis (strain CQ1 / CVCC 102059) TaxID=578461 RepID=R0M603_NOSB1|nr:hypothetical protein NBO_78g0015 [Nosema bombycis CQ1]|eukprot:EOB13389.1 hypothetical protein NBO_78g0015 [Nosema bombycis CQ1]